MTPKQVKSDFKILCIHILYYEDNQFFQNMTASQVKSD